MIISIDGRGGDFEYANDLYRKHPWFLDLPSITASDDSNKSTSGLMTVEEVAEALHEKVTINGVRQLINDGKLKSIKIGSRLYVTKQQLKDFIECRENDCQHDLTSEKTKELGSSLIKENNDALDFALQSVKKLKER